ncbi:Polyprotein [Phytophthora palmivora]|uniref:Polyprotein n=1 Tax=Phytophthora palmivora TaxID=4796 RepID=A0A2P4XF21_9STRA|nr:Polyprotein [Phytophthora palmivora]
MMDVAIFANLMATMGLAGLPGNPVNEIARKYFDDFSDIIPVDCQLTTVYTTRLIFPAANQVKAIADFIDGYRHTGHVRESISPHSNPTFCVTQATGGWRTARDRKHGCLKAEQRACYVQSHLLHIFRLLADPRGRTRDLWLALGNYLHNYTNGYASMMSSLAKKDIIVAPERQSAFAR